MARSAKIPEPLERRHLLERQLDPARALAIAEAYLEADRRIEALAFLGRAEAVDRLESLAEEAVAQGDAFLLESAARELGAAQDSRRWRALAERARSAGLLEYAATAERHAAAEAETATTEKTDEKVGD